MSEVALHHHPEADASWTPSWAREPAAPVPDATDALDEVFATAVVDHADSPEATYLAPVTPLFNRPAAARAVEVWCRRNDDILPPHRSLLRRLLPR